MEKGKASIEFSDPPLILAGAAMTGKKEGEGPLGHLFDKVWLEDMLGMDTWEEGESRLQKETAAMALEKAGLRREDIRYLFAGDLLGQLIATSFGLMEFEIPLFGLYGACSTMGEAMSLGAMTVGAGYAARVMALTSSHFATAEKQFRFPLGYGNQRPFAATWTTTACGAVIISRDQKSLRPGAMARITGITTGKIVDMQFKDSMNMGAAMAPAAFHTIEQNLEDFRIDETWYDQIITGDLGEVGSAILLDFMKNKGRDIKDLYMDCGMTIYNPKTQDTHAGGSGCGCSAAVLCAYILPKIKAGVWKRVLFVPTGALLSAVSFNEGQSVPGIAHALVIEYVEE